MADSVVFHQKYGRCSVIAETEKTIIIRTMENMIHECLKSEVATANSLFDYKDDYSAEKTLLKVLAGLISSINKTWGLFSQTAINLLPHQLWVCNRVMKQWPTRMLVADDVGLGKTIEAGIILLAARTSKRANRILILTPAALTQQWRKQLKTKFNLVFDVYSSESERVNEDYWLGHDFVIASIETLRLDNKKRHEHFFGSKPWDLVLIDESHHLSKSSKNISLGYELIEKMEEMSLISSMVFLTATPHQGKNLDFWNLMRLLEPNDFAEDMSLEERYEMLQRHMIRNNKSKVIDMDGNKLFHAVKTYPYSFSYSDEESNFYNLMTSFIQSGYAYASEQQDKERILISLVLTSLQKIASSSVNAIYHTLARRKQKLLLEQKEQKNRAQNDESYIEKNEDDSDVINNPEDVSLFLMKDEIEHLDALLSVASKIKKESRISKILEIIETRFPTENILFFTEYKPTQLLMIKALRQKYGNDSVAFINGDGFIQIAKNEKEYMAREEAMEQFKSGSKRFLVSTDASSEGIDLQDACHVLIHIDLPWNPMRMQQRVGRVYRYGQQEDVSVAYAYNPSTVDDKIWLYLNEKIKNIITTFDHVQSGEPEDLLDMVIGMKDPDFYASLHDKAMKDKISTEDLDSWFDIETKKFGEEKALDAIQNITGHAQSFDLSFLKEVPDLDISDLFPFMKHSVEINGEEFKHKNTGYFFKTPAVWRKNYLVNKEYKDIIFSRDSKNVSKICAVGNTVVNEAISGALAYRNNFAIIPGNKSYLIVRVFERVTEESGLTKFVLFAYEIDGKNFRTIHDSELFKIINTFIETDYNSLVQEDMNIFDDSELIDELKQQAFHDYESAGVKFSVPEAEVFAFLQCRGE